MKQRKFIPFALAGTGLAVALALAVYAPGARLQAADHLDPPGRTDPAVDSKPDTAADIADVFAWHTDTSLIVALTFAGPQPGNNPGTYDPDVLYTINISNADPRTTADFPIQVRFGRGANAGEFGVQITGVPGVTGAITGPVDTNLSKDGVLARAGLFDDPFFFDLQGFRDTRTTGTLSFNKDRNFFNSQNDTAIVLEIPRSRIINGSHVVDIWATTSRFGGQL